MLFLLESIGVAYDSYSSYDKLTGKSWELFFAKLIAKSMKDNFVVFLGFKSFFREKVTNITFFI